MPSRVTVLDAMGNKHTVTTDKDDIKKLASRLGLDHPEHSSAEGFTVNAQGFDVDLFVKRANDRELKIWKARG
ncbi:MAG: hypothetical protein Q7R50_08270 [Dehalococcoidales bacterium]|nr:hypothetical protein [Dehalococcoidales bacterium]